MRLSVLLAGVLGGCGPNEELIGRSCRESTEQESPLGGTQTIDVNTQVDAILTGDVQLYKYKGRSERRIFDDEGNLKENVGCEVTLEGLKDSAVNDLRANLCRVMSPYKAQQVYREHHDESAGEFGLKCQGVYNTPGPKSFHFRRELGVHAQKDELSFTARFSCGEPGEVVIMHTQNLDSSSTQVLLMNGDVSDELRDSELFHVPAVEALLKDGRTRLESLSNAPGYGWEVDVDTEAMRHRALCEKALAAI